jgi:hypothetical protein
MKNAWLLAIAVAGASSCLVITDFDVEDPPPPTTTGGGGSAGSVSTGGAGGGGMAPCAQLPCALADGGACPEVIANSSAGNVIADATSFYTADHVNGQVRRFARKGCEVEGFSVPATNPDVVALLGDVLYWNNRDDPPELERCSVSDCSGTREVVITAEANDEGFNSLVPFDGTLFVNRAHGEVALFEPDNGDAYTAIATDTVFGSAGLATLGLQKSGDDLYWIRFLYESPVDPCPGGAGGAGGGPFTACTGAVERFTLGAPPTEELVSGVSYPTSLALDETWAYHRSVEIPYILDRSQLGTTVVEHLDYDLGGMPPIVGYAGLGSPILARGDWVYFFARRLDIVVNDSMDGTQYAPLLVRVRRDDFTLAGLEIVVPYEKLGLGLGESYVPGLFVDVTPTAHAVYWSAGSTYWGATVPP